MGASSYDTARRGSDGRIIAANQLPRTHISAGQVFENWTVIVGGEKYDDRAICKCSCGTLKSVLVASLVRGKSGYCGSYSRHPERKTNAEKHREASIFEETKEYRTWKHIKKRCLSQKCPQYRYYGARGITVYEPWIKSYELFLSHIGRAPTADHSIDRIDNSRGYEPGNVRWATRDEQARNKRNNVWIELNGEKRTATDWCRLIGISKAAIQYRIAHGYNPEKILETPKPRICDFCGKEFIPKRLNQRCHPGYCTHWDKERIRNKRYHARKRLLTHEQRSQIYKEVWDRRKAERQCLLTKSGQQVMGQEQSSFTFN